MRTVLFCLLALLVNLNYNFANDCNAREYDTGIVCVCNSSFCDSLPQIGDIIPGSYQLFTSNEEGLRFEISNGSFSDGLWLNALYINVDRTDQHQTVLGYGGTFTDSAGYNIASLSEAAQENLLNSYFSESGSEYNLCRVPIGGADFSTYGYTYADEGNGTLDAFALADPDYDYKIPYIKAAFNITNGNLRLFGSAWSAPPWAKTSGNYTGGSIYDEYYQLWADYHIKFFEAYRENGIEFWGLTLQNEPGTGFLGGINSNAFYPYQLITWLKENLGPAIRNSSFSDLKIIIHDDQAPSLIFVPQYFADDEALSYIDGVGVHWYIDSLTLSSVYTLAQTPKKDTFALMTEACSGYLAAANLEEPVSLGSWSRGTDYIESILDYATYNFSGWIDWNLVLDLEGGPNWVDNFVDAPIIVNATADEFYKQPMYYALAHVSKYVPPDSVRIETSVSLAASLLGLKSAGFLRPDGTVVLIVYNSNNSGQDVVISDGSSGYTTISFSANSINTVVYN